MKAIVYKKYGSPDVLELVEMEKPVPADGQVLVRVHASSVNPLEWYAMTGLILARPGTGMFKPTKDPRLGTDFAGVVEAIGANVKDFQPGDEVYGGKHGAFADYLCVKEASIGHKPANATFEQAAAVPIAGLTALQALRDHGNVQPGQKVLINGASGGVGTFAVQIAKAWGAEVTAVCSPRSVESIRSLGADRVIDYTKEDFTRSEERYDLVLDIAGSRSWRECKRVLKPNATFVIIGAQKGSVIGPLNHIIKLKLSSLRASQKVIFFMANFNRADFAAMNELIETGKVNPVIDRQYDLKDIRKAMAYLGEGHAKGKIVLTVQGAKGK